MTLVQRLVTFGLVCVYAFGPAYAIRMEACSRGKYLWKDESPTLFFYCYTANDAVKMKCRSGYYMCKIPGKPFEPCDCTEGYDNLEAPSTYESTQQEYEVVNKKDYTNRKQPLPHNGCPDPYLKHPSRHMFDGDLQTQITDLAECQHQCLQMSECLGVDWNRIEQECYFIYSVSLKYGLVEYDPIDHYRRTSCMDSTTPMPAYDSDNSTTQATSAGPTVRQAAEPMNGYQSYTPVPNMYRVARAGEAVARSLPYTSSNDSHTTNYKPKSHYAYYGNKETYRKETTPKPGGASYSDVKLEEDGYNETDEIPSIYHHGNGDKHKSEKPHSYKVETQTPHPTTIVSTKPTEAPVTLHVPDSGCPESLQRFDDTSHPFGINITERSVNDDFEECKLWCLMRGYCAAVDFNFNTTTCFYLPEVDDNLLTYNPESVHVRKVTCSPPLECWEQGPSHAGEEAMEAVTDVNTPQVRCKGLCFVRVTGSQLGNPTMIERGCDTSATQVQCAVGPDTLMAMTCHCDTNRCNGLSMDALASQILYLPLDGDLSDHSGKGVDGLVTLGYNPPSFSCLLKSVNCSAIFSGSQCVSVPQIASTQLGEVAPPNSDFTPQASFAVWFQRLQDGSDIREGIFGNSADENMSPSWQIVAEGPEDFVSAGVETTTSPTGLEDFPFALAPPGQWHLAVLTYDGFHDIGLMRQATSQFYIDGALQLGNSRADQGSIGLRNQPATVGCVMGQNFTGLIDEVRIFKHALSQHDVDALMAMMDANFL